MYVPTLVIRINIVISGSGKNNVDIVSAFFKIH